MTVTLISTNVFAQDLIVEKNGQEIKAKIIKVDTREVCYKNFSNVDDATETIALSEIRYIKYENAENITIENDKTQKTTSKQAAPLKIKNGYFIGETKINESDFIKAITTNEEAFKKYKSGKSLNTLGLIIALPSAAIAGYSLGNPKDDNSGLYIGGLTCIGGYLFVIAGNIKIKNAVKAYNKSQGITYNLNMNSNGIGIAIQF